MTIDEAIAKYKEITNTDANCPAHCNISCDKCVQESKQLAEWLEELKFRRVLQLQCEKEFFAGYEKGKKEGYNKGYADGNLSVTSEIRNKAINDYMNKLCNHCMQQTNECYKLECPFCTDSCDIVGIAEQLKRGAENDNLRR